MFMCKVPALLLTALLLQGVMAGDAGAIVPYQERWGIYELDLETKQVTLIYASPDRIAGLRLNAAGNAFVFSQRIGGDEYADEEICTLGADGAGFRRLTDNGCLDTYPAWSPDGSRVAFLSWRGETLDIYAMDADGENAELLYDSGFHDADIHWVGDRIAFTRNSRIWIMNDDGSGATRLTDPPRAGVWGDAVLPFGDYDPRMSPDGEKIVFEKMVDDRTRHGNYDLYLINADGTGEVALTEDGWTKGLASWSHSGDSLVYIVSAVGDEGRYDMFMVNPDGSGSSDLTSELFPPGFLAHCAVFSADDSKIFFVGEWWDWKVLATEVTCTVAPGEVVIGDPVTVTGSIEPSVPGATITLTCTEPDGATLLRTVTAGPSGAYRDEYEPSETGRWTVEASWEGDPGHEASESQPREFVVIELEESRGSGGIPGFPYSSITMGLIVGVLLYLRSRQGGNRYSNILIGQASAPFSLDERLTFSGESNLPLL